MSNHYDALFEPLKIGSITIKNRIIMGPMGGTRLLESSKFVDRAGAYLTSCAKGGAGMIITGVTYVQDTKGYGYPIWKDADEFVPKARRVLDAVHAEGCKLFMQLGSGRGRTLISDAKLPGPEGPTNFKDALIAPSELPNVWKPELMHRAMTLDEIHTLVDNFGKAAQMAQTAGFDGVEIHAVHEGYLLDQFTISSTNHRTDEYGGPLENRMRLAKEIIDRIRSLCGREFPVIVRYSVTSKMKGFNSGALPGEPYVEFGRSLEESPRVARMLEEMGYDALDADNGSYDSWYWAHPPVYMPKACNLPEVSYIKNFVDIPVFCGGRVGFPDIAESIVKRSQADAVIVARQFLADPNWVNKMREGRTEDIRPCISCHNGCLGRGYGMPIRCAVNATSMMGGANDLKPGNGHKKVVVIGGGVGGMEAARVSALRGYEAVLFERDDELGGVFRASAAEPCKDVNRALLEWFKRELDRLGVDVRLNTSATHMLVRAESPDAIIVATGGKPFVPPIPGVERENVVLAADFLLKPQPEAQKYVIIGAGLTGCEIGFELGAKGKSVTIVEALPTYMVKVPGLYAANANMIRELLAYNRVEVLTSSSVSEITDNGVSVNTADGARFIEAERVIIATGYKPAPEFASGFEDIAPVSVVGDAVEIVNVKGPVWTAYEAANSV